MTAQVSVQYHVSGQPNPGDVAGQTIEFPRYEFTWTDELAVKHGYSSAREAALDWRDRIGVDWEEVPKITTRNVEVGEWYPVYGDDDTCHGGTGTLIRGSRCPRCSAALEYNGNYWCSECPWVLPEDGTRAEKDAFNLAYVLFMVQTGRCDDINYEAFE